MALPSGKRTGADGFTMKPKRGRLGLGLGLAVLVLILDQASKFFIVDYVMRPPRIIPVTDWFDLVMVWNEGVSFGLFGDGMLGPYVLSGLALAIAVVMGVWLRRAETGWLGWGLGLVIGGAVGNAIDRLHWGAVADFVSVSVPFIPLRLFNPWPAFNVADAAITIGVLLVLADGLFAPRKPLK